MNILPSVACVCFKCGTPYSTKDRVPRTSVCAQCDADLHCCYNCRHYSSRAHNECNENQAEWVRDKDRANYCDYFEPKRGGSPGNKKSFEEDGRAAFENLFKK